MGDIDFGLARTGSVDEAPICQNLTDLSWDVEIREEEENASEEIVVWLMRVLMR